jgi:hypothetical protein
VERLGQVVHGADGQAAHRHLDVGDGGDHHHGCVRPTAANATQQLQPVHLRHAQVAHHERDRRAFQVFEGLLTIAGFEAREAIVAHEVHEHLAQARLIVNNEAILGRARVFGHSVAED